MLKATTLVAARPDAIDATLAQWQAQWPRCGVLLLLPEAEKAAVPALQAVFRARKLPLVGAIFPALVHGAGFVTAGALLIALDPMPPTFLLDALTAPGRPAHARISAAIRDGLAGAGGGRAATAFFIFDAMVPNIGSTLSGVFGDLGHPVRYAGVNAGSETFQPMPCLFDAERCVGDAVAVMLLEESTAAIEHGYPVGKTLMRATSTTGNRINVIDQRPAFTVYQDVIRAEYGIALTHENFYDYAVHFPFGVITAVDVVVRIPVGFADDGSIVCVGEVPPNSILRLLRAPQLADSRCVDRLVRTLSATPASDRDWLLTFYCAGRRMHLGAEAASELAQLRIALGGQTLAGALSLGEIGTLEELGFPTFHNAALVCI